MKCLKALGLATVAAMALTAFLGASSASATVLCTTTSTPCGSEWHVDGLTFSPTSIFVPRTTGGVLEVTCAGVSMRTTKKTTGSSTTTPVGIVEKSELTWSGCTNTTTTLAGGEVEVHSISGTDNGTVTAKGFEVTMIFFGVSCIYGAGAGLDLGELTGGQPAILQLNAVVSKQSGSFACPATTVWEGTLTVTNHAKVYVESS